MVTVTVAECEQVQTAWFVAQAAATGGSSWVDEGLHWTDGPDGLNLMFPTRLRRAGVERGLAHARRTGRDIVGAWLSLDVDPAPLAAAGFERGWSPWWMSAELAGLPTPGDPRIEVQRASDDYRGEHADYATRLAITREQPARAWYAAAYAGPGRRFAGRAWSFRTGRLAGIFDMQVWPRFQRRGLGTGLLAAVGAPARAAGAEHAVLNATPEGKALYLTCGFAQVGAGITWWHHLGN